MERHKRPPFTRHGMSRGIVPLALSLVLLLAGCSGRSNVQLSSGGGASSGGGTISIGAQPRSAFGDLVFLGIMLGVVHGSEGFGSQVRSNPFDAIQPTMPAPELDGARTVNEQDCSKPIENWSANLKCR